MKILKLLVLFLLLAGGIFLALNWGSVFGSISDEDLFGKENLIDVQEECDKIRTAWLEADGWSETLYQQQRDDMNQSKEMRLFTQEGYNTVKNCLIESATNKVCDGFMETLKSEKFSDAALQKYYQGAMTLKTKEGLGGDDRLSKLDKVYSLYTNVNQFVRSTHTVTPHFDKVHTSWTSFASAQKQILDQASSLRNNPLFAEISHLPGFSAGLNEQTLKNKLAAQKASFYNGLSNQITSHFSTLEATQDRVNLFAQIYNNFGSEVYPNDYGISNLAAFKVSYKVKEHEDNE